jgi:hypothetical protein
MRLAGLLALLLAVATVVPARADGVLFTSKQPYWKVGPRDEELSKACSLRKFNMVQPQRFTGKFVGKEGPEVLGIAKGTGLNLYDPTKRAKPNEDYYFRNHGTTQCEVYVGGRKGAKKNP